MRAQSRVKREPVAESDEGERCRKVLGQAQERLKQERAKLLDVEQPYRDQEKAVAAAERDLAEAQKELRGLRLRRFTGLLLDHVELVDILAPEHDQRTCSDTDPSVQGRCARCFLLETRRVEWCDDSVRWVFRLEDG